MKVVVLGSGTSVPHPLRSNSAYWVETDAGKLLLDCGPSAGFRMAKEFLPWHLLDAIWISHFHLDHVGGLAPFLFSTKHAPDTQTRTKLLCLYGPPGLRKLINAFDSVNDYRLLKQKFPIKITEVEALEKFQILGGMDAVVMKTPHTAESHAIHLTASDGATLVYSGDTGYDVRLATFARKVDLLLMECSFVKNKPVEKHLELAEAVDLIRRAEPKTTILTHLYPEWDDEDFANLISGYSINSEVVQAFDGCTFDSGRITLPNGR